MTNNSGFSDFVNSDGFDLPEGICCDTVHPKVIEQIDWMAQSVESIGPVAFIRRELTDLQAQVADCASVEIGRMASTALPCAAESTDDLEPERIIYQISHADLVHYLRMACWISMFASRRLAPDFEGRE